MRLLIYGAGVIGSLYASLFGEAGFDATVYARGRRLESFSQKGLRYCRNNQTRTAKVNIVSEVKADDYYDFIFLTVREDQVHEALSELRNNVSPNIVTMVNTLEPYSCWEEICGKGRIIPAFPGAGGSFKDEVLYADLTPRIIQPTTFAEIDGEETERLKTLSKIFRKSKIPYEIVKDMHIWQLCHLAMVVPIADAYYEAECPERAGRERKVMSRTAKQMKKNFTHLYKSGIRLLPPKMHMFRLLPAPILSIGLSVVFESRFGNTFMYQHSMNAPSEMRRLHEQFYEYINKADNITK